MVAALSHPIPEEELGLGQTVKLPVSISNEIEVLEKSGATIVYRGTIFTVNTRGADIRCNASVEKLSRKITMVPQFRIRNWWTPWVRERLAEDRQVVREVRQWVVYANGDHLDWGHDFIVHRGRVCNDRAISADYRGALVGAAANQEIALPDALLNRIFEPIEQQCLALSNKLVGM